MDVIILFAIFIALGTIAIKAGRMMANMAYLGMLIVLGALVWLYAIPWLFDKAGTDIPLPSLPSASDVLPVDSLDDIPFDKDALNAMFKADKLLKKETVGRLSRRLEEAKQAVANIGQVAVDETTQAIDEVVPDIEVPELPPETEVEELPAEEQDSIADQLIEFFSTVPTQVVKEKLPDTVVDAPIDSPEAPAGATAISVATFSDALSLREAAGSAILYEDPAGQSFLRLDNFSVTNGPDLHVYLTVSPIGDVLRGYTDLGELKSNAGDHNYPITTHASLSKFRTIVIYSQSLLYPYAVAVLQTP